MAATADTTTHPRKDTISLLGAVGMVVGFVIGASIFILVGPLAGQVGPGLPFAYLLAAVPAAFACVYHVQLAGALPTTAANYVAGTRFISPLAGFVSTWMILVGAVFGVPLLAVGFAAYLESLVPGLPIIPTAVAVVVLLALVNVVGLRFASLVQNAMVLLFLVALVVYVVGGLPAIDTANYTPLLPNGSGALLAGAIAAYFSFTGFTVITEVAGEVRNARRTVPLAVIISFVIVLAVYLSVTAVLTGTLNWQAAGESPAAVAESAATFLPQPVVVFISLGALFASATTINAVFATLSRDVLQLGRDRVLPTVLGEVDRRTGAPRAAIAVLAVLSVVGVLLAFSIERYALMTVFAFLVIHVITATAVMRIPTQRPDLWALSPFAFTRAWRWITYVAMVLLVAAIFVLAGTSDPTTVILFFVLAALALPYWFIRRRVLLREGVDLDQSMREFSDDLTADLRLTAQTDGPRRGDGARQGDEARK